MSYYLRAFCTSPELPPLRAALEWVKGQGVDLRVAKAALDTPEWNYVEITYAQGKGPLIADVSRGDLLSDEVDEFRELLEDEEDSAEKRRVLDHLDRSNAVVALQLLGDINDRGYTAAGTFLDYFALHCDALVQADGEGFYVGERLIVELQ